MESQEGLIEDGLMGERAWFLTAVLGAFGCSEMEPAVSSSEQAFSESIHESINADALEDFLRPSVVRDIRNEHSDFSDSDAEHVKWVHADSCAFDETIQQINAHFFDAVVNLVPGGAFEPWSATDDFGRVLHPIQDFYAHSNWVELGFPQFDDPSTTEVEISASDLVDFSTRLALPDGLGNWRAPERTTGDLGLVRGDILMVDMVDVPLGDVDGTGALDIRDANRDGYRDANDAIFRPFPISWQFGLLPHPTQPGAAGFVPAVDVHGAASFSLIPTEGHPVWVMESGQDYRLLISGVGGRPVGDIVGNQCDPYQRDAAGNVIEPKHIATCSPPFYFDGHTFKQRPDDYSCIAYHGSRFALTHDGSARSELNKDTPSSAPTRHPKARALARLQTQYEWCRLVYRTGTFDADGVLLSLWVREGRPANPANTPCAADDGRGPMGVTVTIDSVVVRDSKDTGDDEPGEINLSLALYDDPSKFHRLTKSKAGPVLVNDGGSFSASIAPLTQCVRDGKFRVALHGWDDDDDDANGDFDENGTSPGGANVDDAIIGFTETIGVSNSSLPVGGRLDREKISNDLIVKYHVTRAPDPDFDGLDECGEEFYGTNPMVADTEPDGLPDGVEVNGANPTNPRIADTDGDGLLDGQEDVNRNGAWDASETNPNLGDTDGDLLSDGIEVSGVNPTNPLDGDTDDDGLTDGAEDLDKDGAWDPGETNPNDADTDDDRLADGLEVSVGTNPLDSDSDDDGLLDGNDTDWIESAVAALADGVLKNPSHRNVMLDLLADAEKLAKKGNLKAARDKLETLRHHIDGCGAASDPNDWIVDCAVQIQVRALIDVVLSNT